MLSEMKMVLFWELGPGNNRYVKRLGLRLWLLNLPSGRGKWERIFLQIDGDALFIIQALKINQSRVPWCSMLIEEGKNFLRSWPDSVVSYAPRYSNFLAHNLASWAKDNFYVGYLSPSMIPHVVLSDRIGTSHVTPEQDGLDGLNGFDASGGFKKLFFQGKEKRTHG